MGQEFAGDSTATAEALSGDDAEENLFVRGLHQVRVEAPLMEPLSAPSSTRGSIATLVRCLRAKNVRVTNAAINEVVSVRRDLGA